MSDDADVEALLEAPFNGTSDNGGKVKSEKENIDKKKRSIRKRSGSKSRSRSGSRRRRSDSRSRSGSRRRGSDTRNKKSKSRSRSPGRRRSRSRDRDRRRSRSRNRSKSRDRRSRDRDRDRWSPRRRRSRERYRDRSPPPPRRRSPPSPGGRGGRRLPGPERRDVMPFTPRYSPPKGISEEEMSPEDRDARTVFVMQLSQRIRPRDLEEFFSSVGKVRDVRIITDTKTRRSKGIAYVEFWEASSVPLALGLAGQRLLGVPIIVQHTQAEKNRMASAMLATTFQQNRGPMKLYIGSLHFNITEDMLRGIFEPFGMIDSVQILKEPETNRSRGYGFITYHNADDAKRAMEQLNGFELAGRAMKVGHVTEGQAASTQSLDSDEMDRTGIDLGTTGRLQLMAKLAEGTGLQLPSSAQQVLSMSGQPQVMVPQQPAAVAPPIATQCFMLSNMFDPATEVGDSWDEEIKEDVMDECNRHGGVAHIFVDKASPQGNVYVKCTSIAAASASVGALHGRWYSGRIIQANYVPPASYHQLFPDSAR